MRFAVWFFAAMVRRLQELDVGPEIDDRSCASCALRSRTLYLAEHREVLLGARGCDIGRHRAEQHGAHAIDLPHFGKVEHRDIRAAALRDAAPALPSPAASGLRGSECGWSS